MTQMTTRNGILGLKLPLLPLLAFNAFLLLVPKLALVEYLDSTLWGEVTRTNLIVVMAQDILVALIVFAITLSLLRAPNRLRLLTAALASGFILLLLTIDMRVRELWLKPIDVSLIRYSLHNASGLKSGLDFFFKRSAVYSLTFERFLFYVALIYAFTWLLIAWSVASGNSVAAARWTRTKIVIVATATCCFVILAFSASHYRYRVNENVIAGRLVTGIKSLFTKQDSQSEKLAASFEQKTAPLNLQLSTPRQLLDSVKPFRNVVVVVYESMRWRDLNLLGEGPTLAPTLAGMASDGIVTECYVAVPHSAKAYYTILSGRYPYPGIEMREVVRESNDSIWHFLKDSRQTRAFAISAQNLAFESMGGLLKSLGIEAFETAQLPEAKGVVVQATSSFGTSDKSLYSLGAQYVGKIKDPFAAVFFPLAAHYPYDCEKSDVTRHNLTDYRHCVSESDANLTNFLAALKQVGAMQDTLFVIVGDHGESFGEHGTYVHNSSMYQEEVTVPLIFWSEDGRLGHHVLRSSRQIDIAPTIADLMGAMDAVVPVQGVSILRRQDTSPPVFMATFFDDLGVALVEPPIKYIYEQSADKLLAFDNAADPLEKSPLVLPPETQLAVIQRLRAFLAYQKQIFPDN